MRATDSVPLSKFITLQRGFDLPTAKRSEGPVPVVASTGIAGYHNEAKVAGPGVVIGRSGSIGGGQYIECDFWPLNTTLWVKDFKGNNRRFTYYLLKSIDFIRFNAGAGVPTLNRNHIASLKIRSYDRKEQDRVSSILSAYDDLIENNQRRIHLLEHAARLLYKEWFVRLRFPGHEHVKVVDGIPEEWEKKTLEEIAPLSYGKALKEGNRIPGPFPVYGSSGIVGSHIKALISGPTIIVGRKGNVGSVYWSSNDCWPIDTVYYIDKNNCNFFLYYALQSMSFISTDVAVPGLNRDFAHSRIIIMPEGKIYKLFEDTVRPLRQQMNVLHNIIVKLQTARDLLLPRVMNGEIAI